MIYGERLTLKQLTHNGELRHKLSWKNHPLKCWNYVLIFLQSFALMPLGNCIVAAATATAELNRRGVSVSLACHVDSNIRKTPLTSVASRVSTGPSPVGTLQCHTVRKPLRRKYWNKRGVYVLYHHKSLFIYVVYSMKTQMFVNLTVDKTKHPKNCHYKGLTSLKLKRPKTYNSAGCFSIIWPFKHLILELTLELYLVLFLMVLMPSKPDSQWENQTLPGPIWTLDLIHCSEQYETLKNRILDQETHLIVNERKWVR